MINPYLVRKIHIATSNKNNSSLLMWQPQETGPHTSVKTNWSNCLTMHSSFRFNEHLHSQQQDTCVYGGNNKFGNPDSHTGSLTISHFLLGFTLLKMGDAVCKLSGLIAQCGHIHTGRTFSVGIYLEFEVQHNRNKSVQLCAYAEIHFAPTTSIFSAIRLNIACSCNFKRTR